MNNIEITNQLFEAINTIINEHIKNLPYDKTIIATIINNENKGLGQYKVQTRKGSTFLAYSENSNYKINDQVYILIPSGDYSERKFILSKYITGQELLDNDLIQDNEYINPEGKLANWDELISIYRSSKEKESQKEFIVSLLKRAETLKDKIKSIEKLQNIPEILEKEKDKLTLSLSQLEQLSLTGFGVELDNLETYLEEVYNFQYKQSAVTADAVREYLAEHPEVIQAAVDAYLETKE